MLKKWNTITLVITLFILTSCNTANFQSGWKHLEKGNYSSAYGILKPLAESGDMESQFGIAHMYANGYGIPRDLEEAAKWYKLSAAQGDIHAQNDLARIYQKGLGAPINYSESLKWYLKAASNKNLTSFVNIGYIYENGLGVPIDLAKAIRWYEAGANLGNKDAQYNMGYTYSNGMGVAIDHVVAHKWWSLSENQGDLEAKESRKSLEIKMRSSDISKAESLRQAWKKLSFSSIDFNLLAHTKLAISSTNSTEHKIQPTNQVPVAKPNDIAVIIGNSNYSRYNSDIPDVVPAYNDADEIEKYFINHLGLKIENIINLRDATSAQLVATFGNDKNHKGKLYNWTRSETSNVYVYYSGHGAPSRNNGTSFLVPSDVAISNIELSGYSLNTLYKNLSLLPSKSTTLILESCFSGTIQNGTLFSNASPLYQKSVSPVVPKNITVIAAGASDQIASWEKDKSNSLFTKYFLSGMTGAADAQPYGNSDGTVKYNELSLYLEDTMSYFSRRYYDREQNAQIFVSN